MKIMIRLGVLFYMVTTLFLGCFMLLFVLNWISLQEVVNTLSVIYSDPKIRGIFGIIAVVILLKNFIYARAISGTQKRDKTIAFDNPGGRVTVSLTVLEDLVQRVIAKTPEIREVRSSVTAGKKGFEIKARLVLNAEGNIPEMTARIQELVKRRIQDAIGVEEPIVVRVDIIRIISDKSTARQKKIKDKEEPAPASEPIVPFPGYRA